MTYSIAELAYLAGIVDGEGSFTANNDRRRATSPYRNFRIRLTVTNTNLTLLHWLKDRFGGCICGPKQRQSGWKPSYEWQAQIQLLRLLLPRMIPYLVIKREHALIVKELLTLSMPASQGRKRGVPVEMANQRDALIKQLKHLNKRGIESSE